MSDEQDKVQKELATRHPIAVSSRGLVLTTINDMWRFSEMVVQAGLAPRSFKLPQQVMVAIQTGAELGMTPIQSLQGLVVIEGKVGMYGATARALIENSPQCEYIKDNLNTITSKELTDEVYAQVTVKRANRKNVVTRRFSVSDAKRAGLWGKTGSAWTKYPARMLYWRALGFALNDAFGDVLRGLKLSEELEDYPRDRLVSGDVAPAVDLDDLAERIDEDVDRDVEPVGVVNHVGEFASDEEVHNVASEA